MSTLTPPALNYSGADSVVWPFYKSKRVLPIDGVQTVVQTTAGGQEVIFDVPAGCYNLSQTVLEMKMTLAALALNANWVSLGCASVFRRVQFYDEGGVYLVDLDQAGNA